MQQTAYRALAQNLKLSIFEQPWWLDITAGAENWDAVIALDKDESILGTWAFGLKKQMGFLRIFQPAYTPYLGPRLFYPNNQSAYEQRSFEHKVLAQLIRQVPDSRDIRFKWKLDQDNWLPFYWENFEQTTRYTYIIRKTCSREEAFSQLKSTVKRQINKAGKQIEIRATENPAAVLKLFEQSLQKQESEHPVDSKMLMQLHQGISEHQCGCILEAVLDKRVVAAITIVWDNEQMYYLYGGYDNAFSDSGAKTLLFWQAICKSLDMGLDFNFEGSMIPGVERFFRSFGGTLSPVFFIYKRQHPFTLVGI